MGALEFSVKATKGCTKKWQRVCTWCFIWLKSEHVSTVEGAPDGSSESTPTFKVEIKGTIEVTTELHLKRHMVVDLLVQNSSQNNSRWTWGVTLCCTWRCTKDFTLKNTKSCKKMERKRYFDVAIYGSLVNANNRTPLNLKFGSFTRPSYLI